MERRNRQSGFTLIELMIVVAIIGILASVAMPQARNYTARAKVTEAIMQLTNCRTSVQEVYSSGGALPGLDEWGCGEGTVVSKFVERLSVNQAGIITVTIGNQVGDLRLFQMDVTLAPLNTAGQVMSDLDQGSAVRRWRCGSTADGTNTELVNFMPSTCRGT